MSQFFLVLLLLVCPLMMIFMMRGHGGHHGQANEPVPVEELRRQRDELDSKIADRESRGTSSGDRSPEPV